MSYSEDEKIVKLLRELCSLNAQLGEYSTDELKELNLNTVRMIHSVEERDRLIKKRIKLEEEYNRLLLEVDRIRIRTTPSKLISVTVLRDLLLKDKDLDFFWKLFRGEIVDLHQDWDEGVLRRGDFLRNYYRLKPPYVKPDSNIPEGIKNICHESRWSYVYGQYSASIALSRTIIETVLKQKFNIEGNHLAAIIDEALKKGFISKQAKWEANGIRILANQILHSANVASEEQARKSLSHILNFIEEIYLN